MSARDVDAMVSTVVLDPSARAFELDNAARSWLEDCGCPRGWLYGQYAENALSVRHEVDRQYVGGWSAFVADLGPV